MNYEPDLESNQTLASSQLLTNIEHFGTLYFLPPPTTLHCFMPNYDLSYFCSISSLSIASLDQFILYKRVDPSATDMYILLLFKLLSLPQMVTLPWMISYY